MKRLKFNQKAKLLLWMDKKRDEIVEKKLTQVQCARWASKELGCKFSKWYVMTAWSSLEIGPWPTPMATARHNNNTTLAATIKAQNDLTRKLNSIMVVVTDICLTMEAQGVPGAQNLIDACEKISEEETQNIIGD